MPKTISGIYDSKIRRYSVKGGPSAGRFGYQEPPPHTGDGPTLSQANYLNVLARRLGHPTGQALARFENAPWTIAGAAALIELAQKRLGIVKGRRDRSQPPRRGGTAKRPAG